MFLFSVVLAVIVSVISPSISSKLSNLFAEPCLIETEVKSDIVSRIFFRDTFEKGEQILEPEFQELFYEWNLSISSDNPVNDVFLKLDHVGVDDRLSVTPTHGKVSHLLPLWLSGFPEPHRNKPDYFFRTIEFDQLDPMKPKATIKIRRPLSKPLLISPQDIIRIGEATATNCTVSIDNIDFNGEAGRLEKLANTLAGNIYRMNSSGRGVSIRSDPGDLIESEVQATVEMRCKNLSCEEMTANQLEARLGKSPHQHVVDQSKDKFRGLAKDLEEIFGCIEGPYAEENPTIEGEILNTCNGPFELNPEQIKKLDSVMKKHGVNLIFKSGSETSHGE